MGVLKLTKPIMINGQETKEIKYNFDELTAQDLLNVGRKYKAAGNVVGVQELDPDYHLYIFAESAIKADSELDITDIFRMGAKDATKAQGLVRGFFFIDSEDTSESDT